MLIKGGLVRGNTVTVVNNIRLSQPITISLPQGSILALLFFLIFINNLPRFIQLCEATLYANYKILSKNFDQPTNSRNIKESKF